MITDTANESNKDTVTDLKMPSDDTADPPQQLENTPIDVHSTEESKQTTTNPNMVEQAPHSNTPSSSEPSSKPSQGLDVPLFTNFKRRRPGNMYAQKLQSQLERAADIEQSEQRLLDAKKKATYASVNMFSMQSGTKAATGVITEDSSMDLKVKKEEETDCHSPVREQMHLALQHRQDFVNSPEKSKEEEARQWLKQETQKAATESNEQGNAISTSLLTDSAAQPTTTEDVSSTNETQQDLPAQSPSTTADESKEKKPSTPKKTKAKKATKVTLSSPTKVEQMDTGDENGYWAWRKRILERLNSKQEARKAKPP